MATSIADDSGEGWVPAGTIKVSDAALAYAREFHDAIGQTQRGDWVVAFEWATATSVKRGPNEPYEEIGPNLSLGAFERHQVPPEFILRREGLEYVIKIPKDVWEKSAHRLIDYDPTLLFKYALR